MQNPDPLISVIVPTKNESANIVRCLVSIKHQTYNNIEIIVVDNYSTDDTVERATLHADLVTQHGPERCAQRNYGASQADGEFLLFVDADMELTPRVIEECVDAARNGAKNVVVPEVCVGEGFWARCKAFEKHAYGDSYEVEAGRFFSTDIFHRSGGYDEELTAFEDWELALRVDAVCSRYRICAEIVHHEGALTLVKTFNKKRYYARSYELYKSKLARYGKKSQISVSRLQYFLPLFKRHPLLCMGTLMMKAVELLGFIVGLKTSGERP